jgi:hypothetical protein
VSPHAPSSERELWIPPALVRNSEGALQGFFRQSLVRQLKDFIVLDEEAFRARYRDVVLSKDPEHPLRASCLWLRDVGVIDDEDMSTVDEIRRHRNELAHELPAFLGEIDRSVNLELLNSICELVSKVDRWFVINVHAATDPAFDGKTVEGAEVTSGRMALIQQMTDATIGDRRRALQRYGECLAAFRRYQSGRGRPNGG